MAVFWTLAGLMTALALAFVLVPLLRARAPQGPSAMEANLEALRGQRRELEADIASGIVAPESREQVLDELVRRADADLAANPPVVVGERGKPWIPVAAAALGIPALAFGLYVALGTPMAADPRLASAASGSMDPKGVEEMVDKLAAKVKERPDDARGWALLARSTAALGRFQESAQAFEHLARLVPDDASVLADYADALGMAQGQKLSGKPFELVQKALAIEPANKKALALAATASMEMGRNAEAISYWERLAGSLAPGSDDEKEVQQVIAELRGKSAGPSLAAAPKPAPAAMAPGARKSVSGLVTVAPEVASRIGAGDTVFVFARAEGGPRAPLAVLRGSARELPLRFALDDSMAMSPQWSLSKAGEVRIEARVSKSGNAMPQPGDVTGVSGVVKPGASDVRVVLDKVQP
jgi:cytochrome c-type biogenesis protein CcmH